jgi:hypothetical protein
MHRCNVGGRAGAADDRVHGLRWPAAQFNAEIKAPKIRSGRQARRSRMSEQRPIPTMPAAADPATDDGTLDGRHPNEEWSMCIDAWASTAHTGPMSTTTRRDRA